MQYRIKQISLFNCYLLIVIIYQSLVKTSNDLNEKSSKNGSVRNVLISKMREQTISRSTKETQDFYRCAFNAKYSNASCNYYMCH